MKHPSNRFQRRLIELRKYASRGTSRVVTTKGSLPIPLRHRVFRSSKKSDMPGVKRVSDATAKLAEPHWMPDFRLIARLEKMRGVGGKSRQSFDANHSVLLAALNDQKRRLADLETDGLLHPKEILPVRKKISFKGKKWEIMKKENRKRRANTITSAYSKEIEADPRLKANKNAIASILAYERIRVRRGQTLMSCLIEKFESEKNKDAVSALRMGHKLVFIKEQEKWRDSEVVKIEDYLERQRMSLESRQRRRSRFDQD